MSWFNRLSTDGEHVVGQRTTPDNAIELDGVRVAPGISPVWLGREVFAWADGDQVWTCTLAGELGSFRCIFPINYLQGAPTGAWVASHRGDVKGYTHNGLFVLSEPVPTLRADGTLDFSVPPDRWTETRVSAPDGDVWVIWQQPWTSDSGDTRLVATLAEDRTRGYVLAIGDTNYPDAAWRTSSDQLRVVWTHRGGATGRAIVDTTAERVDLSVPDGPPVETWESSGDVVEDVWPFIVGDDQHWPRVDPMSGLRMDRILKPHSKGVACYFVKFGNDPNRLDSEGRGRAWERWDRIGVLGTWHTEDHIDEPTGRGECYTFSNGAWIDEPMSVGQSFVPLNNAIRFWRDGGWTDWAPFPYRMTLLAYERSTFSNRERIRFRYDPGGSRDTFEDYVCYRDTGWTEWTEYDQKTGAQKNHGAWTQKLDATPIQPAPGRVVYPPETDMTIEQLAARVAALEQSAIKAGDKVALQSDGGKILVVEEGGGNEGQLIKVEGDVAGEHVVVVRPAGAVVARGDYVGPWGTLTVVRPQ